MAARAPSVKRYIVRLSAEERQKLEAMIRKGTSPAARLLKARVLLKVDVSEAGEGWSDSRIVEALETSVSIVYRVRRRLVEEGLQAVLSRKAPARPSVPRIFDGEKEARLIALAAPNRPRGTRAGACGCSRARWSSSASSRPPATRRSSGRSKKRFSAAPPQILGHSAQGQRRFRSGDGGRAVGLHAAPRSRPAAGLLG
jgi:Homeodomain-like domain